MGKIESIIRNNGKNHSAGTLAEYEGKSRSQTISNISLRVWGRINNEKEYGMWIVAFLLSLAAGCTHAPPSIPLSSASGSLPIGSQNGDGPTQTAPRRFTQGEVLYLRHCADCHGWEGRGDGPLAQVLATKPLDLRQHPELLTQHSPAELAARILHGTAFAIPVGPTAPLYSEHETSTLLVYLERLPTLPWSVISRGKDVYDALCAACHGLYGRGDGLAARTLAVALQDLSEPSYQDHVSNEELFRTISDGKGTMPGAGDVLTPQEIKAAIAFLRVLSPGYELYGRFCAYCHGPEGHSLVPSTKSSGVILSQRVIPSFDYAYFQTHTTEQVRVGIQHMQRQPRPAMPHFAPQLSADEMADIVTYLRSLLAKP